ncbi:MAG: sigma-54-dependent Fis family transcriptional regulator [Legionellaceae bacterium]|nr:sigma-54-dependent Fis family transcriptional regulator [Legionellaceae bacterium]HCA89067.1 sigma-54-dependent Fis family transcriptional regulator [Legionellales bacterium]|tara:strand:- start:3136 stop:4563 length:1428 start_codon:yes stop_codon:yes gene_type:complete
MSQDNSKKDIIFIIDDEDKRRDKLMTIIDFLGKKSMGASYQNPQSLVLAQTAIVMIGSQKRHKDETIDLIEEIVILSPDTPIIIICEHDEQEFYQLLSGVVAVLSLPFTYTQMIEIFYQCQALREQKTSDKYSIALCRNLVGESQAIKQVRKLIHQVADTEASVLILGESGTGKEVVARNIHALSPRCKKTFIPINCGAIPKELLESELFGHEKGAFTGAITTRQGRFELAEGGTLFLDEIGDMPLTMQVKLLRVLQERCFERVGSNKSIKADVRIIAATHRNLENAIKNGHFREDLFYRLNVFPIDVPPLRARKNDLPLLIDALIARLEHENKPGMCLLPDALEALSQYHWPGNVRELANFVERLSILFPNGVVNMNDLPERFKGHNPKIERGVIDNERDILLQQASQSPRTVYQPINLKEHMAKTELALIHQALEQANWVVAHAAHYLNIRRTTLVEKMRKYRFERPDKDLDA